jgi:hypothetical protein
MQRRSKHASTTTKLLLEKVLCNPLQQLNYNGNGGVFYVSARTETKKEKANVW